jgi:23S rRNA (cytosine1962-C5)-methyltransferase
VLEEEFHAAVIEAVDRTDRRYEIVERAAHAPDHPATFDEARYLKAVYLRFRE